MEQSITNAETSPQQPETDVPCPEALLESALNVDPTALTPRYDTFEDCSDGSDDNDTLFVGDLTADVDERLLFKKFSNFGQVVSVEIKRDKTTGRSLGYAFIRYENSEQADLARREAHRMPIGRFGKLIRIGRAQRNTCLYIPDIDPTVTSEELKEIFQPYGELNEDDTYVVIHSYAFVKFKRREDAEKSKRTLDGTLVKDKRMNIKWAELDQVEHVVQIQFDKKRSALINEASIAKTFSRFGRIRKVRVPRRTLSGESLGTAFVHFANDDAGYIAARTAVQKVKNIGSVQVWCHSARQYLPTATEVHRAGEPNKISTLGVTQSETVGIPVFSSYEAEISGKENIRPNVGSTKSKARNKGKMSQEEYQLEFTHLPTIVSYASNSEIISPDDFTQINRDTSLEDQYRPPENYFYPYPIFHPGQGQIQVQSQGQGAPLMPYYYMVPMPPPPPPGFEPGTSSYPRYDYRDSAQYPYWNRPY